MMTHLKLSGDCHDDSNRPGPPPQMSPMTIASNLHRLAPRVTGIANRLAARSAGGALTPEMFRRLSLLEWDLRTVIDRLDRALAGNDGQPVEGRGD